MSMTDAERQRLKEIESWKGSGTAFEAIQFLLDLVRRQEERIEVAEHANEAYQDSQEVLESRLVRYKKVVEAAKKQSMIPEMCSPELKKALTDLEKENA